MRLATRLNACAALCLLPVAAIVLRLAWLQIVLHKNLSSRLHVSTERQVVEIIPRGRILDRRGRVLAESLPAWSSFLDLKLLRESGEGNPGTLRRIAAALELDADEVLRLTKSRSRTAWLKRKMGYEDLKRLKALDLRSVGIVADERRFHPNGDLARSLLGDVNAEGRGNAGLEYAFDRSLSARAVRIRLMRDGAGRAVWEETHDAFERPPDLRLTIDRSIQYFAEKALEETVLKHQAKSGLVLIQDPASGALLAMAQYPPDAMRNAAVQSVYEPGSTFKIVTAAAAIESRTLARGARIDCENGRWNVTSKVRIKDHEKHGELTLPDIMRYSSNIGTAKLGLAMGAETFVRFCRLFGFGYKTGIPLPAESAGLLKAPREMGTVELANAAFGQGVAVTPLQLLGAFSAVANGGLLMEPRVVEVLGESDGRGPVVVRRVAKEETIEELRRMLELVVESGTGQSAAIPGYRAAGKTGTAQKIDPETGTYSPDDFISSFAGYVPARSPRLAILAVIDSPRVGHYGSEVAAPLFSRVARYALALEGVPPDDPAFARAQSSSGALRQDSSHQRAACGPVMGRPQEGTEQAAPCSVPSVPSGAGGAPGGTRLPGPSRPPGSMPLPRPSMLP